MTSRIGFLLLCSVLLTSCSVYSVSGEDGPSDKNVPAGKQLIVREVCKINDSVRYLRNGSLTFDGKELIVVEPFKKLSLYNVTDLTERIISVNPLIAHAWSDSATGGVFVKMFSETDGVNEKSKGSLKYFDLCHFGNTNDLVNWQPTWTKKRIVWDTSRGTTKDVQIQWISGSQLFALHKLGHRNHEFTLLDVAGNEAGQFKLPGSVFGGFDSSEDGIEVYFLSNDKPRAYVMRGVLDSKHEKVKGIERMLQSQWPPNSHTFMDTRSIRLRGLKTGDVRRYIEWTNHPFFLQRRDQENAGLEPAHLASLKFSDALPTRFFELGVLSYAESDYEYELVKSVQKRPADTAPSYFPPFLYRRSGELILIPNGPSHKLVYFVDAVLSDDTWVIVLGTYSTSAIGGKFETTFSVCTLGESP